MTSYNPATAKCSSKIYRMGLPVFMTNLPSRVMEAWVEMVREDLRKREPSSNIEIDWHYVGGRAVVKAIGDKWTVHRAIGRMMPEHDLMQKAIADEKYYQGPYRQLFNVE